MVGDSGDVSCCVATCAPQRPRLGDDSERVTLATGKRVHVNTDTGGVVVPLGEQRDRRGQVVGKITRQGDPLREYGSYQPAATSLPRRSEVLLNEGSQVQPANSPRCPLLVAGELHGQKVSSCDQVVDSAARQLQVRRALVDRVELVA